MPAKEAELQKWGRNIVVKIEANGHRWNIPGMTEGGGPGGGGIGRFVAPDSPFDRLKKSFEAFADKFNLVSDPSTRTRPAIIAKNEAKKAFVSEMRVFAKGYLTYNPTITNAEREEMGLPVHKSGRSKNQDPTIVPKLDPNILRGHRVVANFHDLNTVGTAKPYGMIGAVIAYAILDSQPVIADLTNFVLATRTPYTFKFTDADSGKTVYMAVCWQNMKGHRGPWSDIVSVVIP
jgi:hypothetical protein